MSFHRAELFEALADARWRNEPSDGDDLDRLIDNFAHELAETIRTEADEWDAWPGVCGGMRRAASLIDPEVKK